MLGLLYQKSKAWKIYGADKTLQKLFKEMGIDRYLRMSRQKPPEVTMQEHQADAEYDPQSQQDIILSAHEALMELSEENRRRFGHMVEMLRRESAGEDD
jgi:alpha-glucosidase (family GH31 glycosyl hydrolase)